MGIMRPGGDNIRDDSLTSADIKDGTIVNVDINANAGIALSKLASLSTGRALITDASGFITTSAVTSTEVAYLNGVNSGIQNQLNNKASIDSPAFTGTPTAPTAGLGVNNTQIATTAFVQGLINQVNTGNYAPILAGDGLTKVDNTLSIASSVALTGVPTAPTANQGVGTNQIATTSFVRTEFGRTVTVNSEMYVDKWYTGTSDGTFYRPYKGIQAAINAAYASGYVDVTIIVKSGTEYTEDLLIDRNQLGPANSQYTHLSIIGLVGTNDSANVKVNGTVTISGALTTRVRLQNIQFAATAGVASTALVINGTEGRHYFENCVFAGKVVFQGSWRRWSVFRRGSNTGFDIGGSPVTEGTVGPSVSFYDVGMSGTGTVSVGTVVVDHCGNTYGLTHSGGTLAVLKSNLTTNGLVSTAPLTATNFLFLQDVSFFNGTTYCPFSKTGACYYVFNNVTRAGTETISGTRFKLGASSADFQFRPATASQFSNLSELSVKQALDILGAGVSASDRNLKYDIEDLNEAEIRVAKRLKTLIKKYKFKDDSHGKIYVGAIAQEVIEVFESEGLDVNEYAIVEKSEQGTLGIAYNQLFAFIIAAL